MDKITVTSGWSKRKVVLCMVIVFILVSFFRVGYICMSKTTKGGGGPDSWTYFKYSEIFLNGEFMELTNIPKIDRRIAERPGYPIFIALVRSLFAKDFASLNNYDTFRHVLRIIAFLMYALCAVLSYYIVLKVFGWKVSILSMPFVIGSASTAFWCHWQLTESLFTLLLLLSISGIILFAISEHKNSLILILSGLAFGFASLTRQVLFPMILFIVIWFLIYGFKSDRRRVYIQACLVFVLPALLLYGGWMVRNVIVTGKTYSTILRAGDKMNHSVFRVHTRRGIDWNSQNVEEKKEVFLREYSNRPFTQKVLDIGKGMFTKFCEFLQIRPIGTHQTFWNSIWIKYYVIYNSVTFLLMLVSLFFINREKTGLGLLLWLIIFYFVVVHTVLMVGGGIFARYRVPIEPYMSMLAAYGLSRIYLIFRKKELVL